MLSPSFARSTVHSRSVPVPPVTSRTCGLEVSRVNLSSRPVILSVRVSEPSLSVSVIVLMTLLRDTPLASAAASVTV